MSDMPPYYNPPLGEGATLGPIESQRELARDSSNILDWATLSNFDPSRASSSMDPRSEIQSVSTERTQLPSGFSSSSSGTDSFPSGPHMSKPEGYDYEFVPKADERYECAICLLVLREPRQTPCGHRFCRDCIIKWIRSATFFRYTAVKPIL